MKLKRYILDTKRVVIYDMQNNKDVRKFMMISRYATHFVNGAYKTSDNILDLVEVGDCVEYNNANLNSVKIEVLFITQYNFEAWNNYCLKSSVVSLWKRNGNTMTRYEVVR